MGHTDVVPVNPDGWSRDPFGGELVDGFVWGRGAVDMLNLTASQAVAFRRLADSGLHAEGHAHLPRGRRRGGARHLGRRLAASSTSATRCTPTTCSPSRAGSRCRRRRAAAAGARGGEGHVLVEDHGARHAGPRRRSPSAPTTRWSPRPRSCAASPSTARRRRSTTRGGASSRACTSARAHAGAARPGRLRRRRSPTLPLGLARIAHACTHTTFAPTVAHGGTKTNVIPDRVDARGRHPHAARPDRRRRRARCCARRSAISPTRSRSSRTTTPSTASPIDTPLWDSLSRVTGRAVRGLGAGARRSWSGGTDNRFFRRAGSVGYGFGLFSAAARRSRTTPPCSTATTSASTRSRSLSTQLWLAVAHDFLE